MTLEPQVYLQRSAARLLEGHPHNAGGRKFHPPSEASPERGTSKFDPRKYPEERARERVPPSCIISGG